MSSHKLSIETGRYNKIPKEQRLCNYCAEGKIESEEHFMFECDNYREERSNLFPKIYCVNESSWDIEAVKNIFLDNDLKHLIEFGKYLTDCWKKRIVATVVQEVVQCVEKSVPNIFCIQPKEITNHN